MDLGHASTAIINTSQSTVDTLAHFFITKVTAPRAPPSYYIAGQKTNSAPKL
jgi:hypothetical protein